MEYLQCNNEKYVTWTDEMKNIQQWLRSNKVKSSNVWWRENNKSEDIWIITTKKSMRQEQNKNYGSLEKS